MDSSHEVFKRLIAQKHSQIIQHIDQFFKTIVCENLEQKYSAATNVIQASRDLASLLTAQDQPTWLKALIETMGRFEGKSANQIQTLEWLISHRHSIRTYDWNFDSLSGQAFDFDSIFEHYRSESRLPELFEEIIKILEDIRASEEVEKITMLNALGKVIATLKHSKNGSYLSMNAAWSFLINFVKNYLWEELHNIPGLSSLLTALKNTLQETNTEMNNLNIGLEKEINQQVSSKIKGFQCSDSFSALSYGYTGEIIKGLPSPPAIDEVA